LKARRKWSRSLPVSGCQESTPGQDFLAGIINLNPNLGGSEEMNLKSRIAGLMLVSVVAMGLNASTALARPSIVLDSGQTRVSLNDDFIAALGALGLSAGSVGSGSLRGTIARFPVVGGVVDLQNAKGEINHSGWLALATQATRVELSSFNIETSGPRPLLTGLVTVNGDFVGRIPLFWLELPVLTLPIQPRAFGSVYVPGVKVTLAPEAAQALNAVFKVSAFAPGFSIGTARVFAISSNSGPGRGPHKDDEEDD
jgi:hypothetical protein